MSSVFRSPRPDLSDGDAYIISKTTYLNAKDYDRSSLSIASKLFLDHILALFEFREWVKGQFCYQPSFRDAFIDMELQARQLIFDELVSLDYDEGLAERMAMKCRLDSRLKLGTNCRVISEVLAEEYPPETCFRIKELLHGLFSVDVNVFEVHGGVVEGEYTGDPVDTGSLSSEHRFASQQHFSSGDLFGIVNYMLDIEKVLPDDIDELLLSYVGSGYKRRVKRPINSVPQSHIVYDSPLPSSKLSCSRSLFPSSDRVVIDLTRDVVDLTHD